MAMQQIHYLTQLIAQEWLRGFVYSCLDKQEENYIIKQRKVFWFFINNELSDL